MESEYINGGEGYLGQLMEGKTGKGAKYWSTTFDQIEDADIDFQLIAQKLGLGDSYDPKKKYSLIVIDTKKTQNLTGVKSMSSTYENLSKFANTELPDEFPKSITDKIMNNEYQKYYLGHHAAAKDGGYLEWHADDEGFDIYLNTLNLNKSSRNMLLRRMAMHQTIGNNQDYVGNGLTMDQIKESVNAYGAVETFNFERKTTNLKQLEKIDALIYVNN